MHTYVNSLASGYFPCFSSSADLKNNQIFRKKYFRNTIRVSNNLEPDQARRYVGPDLVPNYVERLSADDTSWQRVKKSSFEQLKNFVFSTKNYNKFAFLYFCTGDSDMPYQ